MKTSFTTLLSCSRWLAVFAVVLYHVRFLLFAPYDNVQDKGLLVQLYYLVTSLGHEGFVLYMLASGMLLGGLSLRRWSQQGPNAWRDVAHKSLWFYSFLVPALLIGGILDFAGSCVWKCTGVYAYFGQFSPDFSFKAVTGNLFPVQRFIVPGLGSNTMLYLLAYECWSYLAFAAFVLPGRRWTSMIVGLALVLEGAVLAPEFLGYLILWVMGAAAFHYRAVLTLRMPRGLPFIIFIATLSASRLIGAQLAGLPEHVVLVARTLLDLQLGVGLTILLLALGRGQSQGGVWQQRIWRLNRRFPTASSVILASHFPLMMFVVATTSHSFGMPIAGAPRPVVFAFSCALIIVLYAYAWCLSRLAIRLVRLVPRGARYAASSRPREDFAPR